MTPFGVLVVARDAGAASALAPVVAALIDEGAARPEIVAWANARAVFEAEGLPVREFAEDAEPREIESLLASIGAAIVLSGTSLHVELDSRYWAAADAAGLPSLALLDHWKNYAERFTVASSFDVLPTVIAVMDDVAAHELVALGCPPDRVRVTGQPRFDALLGVHPPDLRERARGALGIDASRRVAVFASQPRGIPYDEGGGFTQEEALAAFFDALEEVAPDALALVKLHPVEQMEPIAAAVSTRGGNDIRLLDEGSTLQLAAAADVFCGMTSIVLLDAALLGVPTVSIRPGCGASHFVDVNADLIRTATTPEEVRAALAEGLAQGHTAPSSRLSSGSTARVREQLRELVAAAGIMRT
jgi:hypothetical protein